VWRVADLAGQQERRPEPPPAPPLEATLTSRKATYTLDLGGKSVEEFAGQLEPGKPLPPSPEVDLVLTLRNTSNVEVTVDLKGSFQTYLVGEGALNHPELPYQTGFGIAPTSIGSGYDPPPETKRRLAPGESCSIPLRSLDQGHDQQSYWLLPGEYTLHVAFHTSVNPPLQGWSKDEETGTGYGTLRPAPLRLKVVAGTK
jgi:hypothetical protein